MKPSEKPMRLSQHAQQHLAYRGSAEAEVAETIRTMPWRPAEAGRLEARKEFVYDNDWNGRHYQTKQVRPIFVDEADEIVVVTVYVYYF